MASIPVVVKHSGKKYDVEIDPSSTGEDFKLQLFSLTNVEPERQKILVKGGQLKDDTDLGKLGFKNGQVIMMMGTPSEGAAAQALARPKEAIKFSEDMTEAELAQSAGATPAGLQNLGNTCYMNSTLQALRAIPELQDELLKYKSTGTSAATPSPFNFAGSSGIGGSADLTGNLRDLYKQMSSTQEGFPPLMFLQALRTTFPQFAQRSREGHGYAQQDAEEAWSQIVSQLRQKLKSGVTGAEKSFVDDYMSGTYDSIMECDELAAKEGGEEPVKSSEKFFKLNCHIGLETNHLRDGLMSGLSEKIEKRSQALDRDAVYTKTSRISRLPKYLPVHFMRFDWRRTTNKKAKIMRKVTFPQELDAVEFCSEELKKQLIPVRDKVRDAGKGDAVDFSSERANERPDENITGLYELRSVITHQGASADSGHYTAFVKKSDTSGKWWWFNDDKVSEVDEEHIKTLAGGGQSHSALILLYRAVPLPTSDGSNTATKDAPKDEDVTMSS